MSVFTKLAHKLSREKPAPPGDVCPWCGESVLGTIERVPIDGRLYHAECAVARMDAGAPSVEGMRGRPPIP
jgi:hypothetical protein